ncbi:hypothetical protein QBC38DRAFT_213529 [Podospora fimiseda]|uniref:RING-type domain-containing protein n=1 Tax=Podospora fimiseda TaxID=252190 RepID=A0AAN6YL60_9PEZI|nr:hypothetical protein QBC38DRAFT_213529 [Podospora fimiseda]
MVHCTGPGYKNPLPPTTASQAYILFLPPQQLLIFLSLPSLTMPPTRNGLSRPRTAPYTRRPSKFKEVLDLTDDTFRGCVNCHEVLIREANTEKVMLRYKGCGCVLCSDCTDGQELRSCFKHFGAGLQKLHKMFGFVCWICLEEDISSCVFPRCGHPVCQECWGKLSMRVECGQCRRKETKCNFGKISFSNKPKVEVVWLE